MHALGWSWLTQLHTGILDVGIIPYFWPDLDDRLRQQVLGLMLQVCPVLASSRLYSVTVICLQSGLAVTVALGSSHDNQSAGLLIPALLPAKTIAVQWLIPAHTQSPADGQY